MRLHLLRYVAGPGSEAAARGQSLECECRRGRRTEGGAGRTDRREDFAGARLGDSFGDWSGD